MLSLEATFRVYHWCTIIFLLYIIISIDHLKPLRSSSSARGLSNVNSRDTLLSVHLPSTLSLCLGLFVVSAITFCLPILWQFVREYCVFRSSQGIIPPLVQVLHLGLCLDQDILVWVLPNRGKERGGTYE